MYGIRSLLKMNLCWPVATSITSDIATLLFPTAVVFNSLYFLGVELEVHLNLSFVSVVRSILSCALSQLAISILLFMAVISV